MDLDGRGRTCLLGSQGAGIETRAAHVSPDHRLKTSIGYTRWWPAGCRRRNAGLRARTFPRIPANPSVHRSELVADRPERGCRALNVVGRVRGGQLDADPLTAERDDRITKGD